MQCIKDTIKNINIVIGCDIGCEYCYARMNNRRFHTTDDFNVPEFYERKLKMLDSTRVKAYFLTGQSDLSGWKDEWIEKVFARICENPDKSYVLLTKRPEKLHLENVPDNAWIGVTVTSSCEKKRLDDLRSNVKAKHYQASFEPLFDDLGEMNLEGVDWIIVGTETGSRKGKSVSKREWVLNICRQAKEHNIPVFMKEDLFGIFGDDEMIQEFPREFLD